MYENLISSNSLHGKVQSKLDANLDVNQFPL
jgi:hypothetical protein